MSLSAVSTAEPLATVLLVDDEPFNLEILLEYLEGSGYRLETAADGLAAWEMLAAAPAGFDVVLLDRMMPRMDGLELLGRIKQHPELKSLPVIMQTALASRAEIMEGLQAGAYYYLTKPFEQEMLLTVVATAVADRLRYRRALADSHTAGRAFGLMRQATFAFRTLDAARDLATVLANACPAPQRVVIGLTELLLNAVEHGNLGITYEEKGRLRDAGRWEAEILERLARPEHADKTVVVEYLRESDRVRVRIRDQGQGFDFQRYLDMDPSRVFDNHGRGIALSRTISFDTVDYRGCGNEVEVTVLTPAEPG